MKKSELKAIIKECLHEELANANLEEGIFGFGKKKSATKSKDNGKDTAYSVNIKIFDPEGRVQFNRTLDELPGKKSAEEQAKQMFMGMPPIYREYKKNKPTEWTFERKSTPPSPKDTTGSNKYCNSVASDLYIPY